MKGAFECSLQLEHVLSHNFGSSCETDVFIIKLVLAELTQNSSHVSVKVKEYIPPFFVSFHVWEVGKDAIFKVSAVWKSVLLNAKLLDPRRIQFDKELHLHPSSIHQCMLAILREQHFC